jgi:uncharacterized protein YdhG (YjbR/CyaY superfamily)
MRAKTPAPPDIDTYIAGFPPDIRTRLEKVRGAIRAAAPNAREKISYHIPTFALCGNLVHFAGYANHIGFYPGAAAVKRFAREIAAYDFAKGSVQFPHDAPLPLGLIRNIVRFRVEQNLVVDAERQALASRRQAKRQRAAKKRNKRAFSGICHT